MSDRAAKESDREKKVPGDAEETHRGKPKTGVTKRPPPDAAAPEPPPAEGEAPADEEKPNEPKTSRFRRGPLVGRTSGTKRPAVGKDKEPEVEEEKESDEGKDAAEIPTSPNKGKGKRKKKEKEKEADKLELEPISPFDRGISIGVKFGGITALVVAIFMALLGYLTYSITDQEVNDQINEGGVGAVSALEKGVDRIFWVKPEEVLKELLKAEKPEEPAKGANDMVVVRYKESLKRYEQLQQYYWEQLKKTSQDALNERLKLLVTQSGNQILSAAVYEREGPAIASYPEKFGVGSKLLKKMGEVDVSEARITADGASVLVRQFDRPISDPEGKTFVTPSGKTAYVTVFVNAKKVDDVRERVAQRIMLVTALGALGGIIITALVSAILTRPIRALEGDIAVVAGGDLDHDTQPRSRDEIGALAHTFNIMTRNLKAAQQHAAERKAIERELSIATEIQTKLLPERIPQIPGLDIHSFYLSAKEVGGDYYDFIVIDQTHLGIIVADVSGKGIPGSMVMTMARSLVRLASVRNVSPADTFKKVNRILAKDIRRGMFVTSIYMVLNVKTHELKVASAGHNPLVVYRAETGENELVKPQGIALGFDKGTIFDNHIQEFELQLKPGDRICAYTDGVNEAMNADSEEFGDERFYNLVKQHARLSSKDFVNAIVAELEAHRGGAEQSDDITITTLAVMK